MLIELKSVFENEGYVLPLHMSVDFSDVLTRGECYFATPVQVDGEFINKTGVVSFKGIAHFTYSAPCDRCADTVTRVFDIPMEHDLVTRLNNNDNDDFLVVENMKLDVDELTHSDVLLNMPTKFLCREDCKGLCSKCGANLNISPCDCSREKDPRLAKLLEFLDDEE